MTLTMMGFTAVCIFAHVRFVRLHFCLSPIKKKKSIGFTRLDINVASVTYCEF